MTPQNLNFAELIPQLRELVYQTVPLAYNEEKPQYTASFRGRKKTHGKPPRDIAYKVIENLIDLEIAVSHGEYDQAVILYAMIIAALA